MSWVHESFYKYSSKIDLKKKLTYLQKIMSEELFLKSKKSTLEKEWKYREYMQMMSKARKNGDKSFVYKNRTYVQSLTPRGVVIYVRKESL